MDSVPTTPTSRRRSSAAFDRITPISSHSRRSSQHGSPTHHRRTSSRISNFDQSLLETSIISGANGGLESLDAELADAWDDDEGFENSHLEDSQLSPRKFDQSFDSEKIRDSGIDVTSDEPETTKENKSPIAKAVSSTRRHTRSSSKYDGEGYPTTAEDIPPTLKATMADVEALSKEIPSTEQENVIPRAIDQLRDLGNQSVIENSTTRLATAHSALSTHLAHQTRLLQTLTYSFLSPLSPATPSFATSPLRFQSEFTDDDVETDTFLSLLTTTMDLVPHPTFSALTGLTQLSASSHDVIDTLHGLSDSLHMSRQVTEAANRRLRSTRELVAEMRREDHAEEQGRRWIEEGKWQSRLQDRECAKVCKDVVGGFEEVCDGIRRKLVAQAEAIACAA